MTQFTDKYTNEIKTKSEDKAHYAKLKGACLLSDIKSEDLSGDILNPGHSTSKESIQSCSYVGSLYLSYTLPIMS